MGLILHLSFVIITQGFSNGVQEIPKCVLLDESVLALPFDLATTDTFSTAWTSASTYGQDSSSLSDSCTQMICQVGYVNFIRKKLIVTIFVLGQQIQKVLMQIS